MTKIRASGWRIGSRGKYAGRFLGEVKVWSVQRARWDTKTLDEVLIAKGEAVEDHREVKSAVGQAIDALDGRLVEADRDRRRRRERN